MCTELIVSLADIPLDIIDRLYHQVLLCYGHFAEFEAKDHFGNDLSDGPGQLYHPNALKVERSNIFLFAGMLIGWFWLLLLNSGMIRLS